MRGVGLKPTWFTSINIGMNLPFRILGSIVIITFLTEGAWYWKKKEERAFNRLSVGLANPLKRRYLFRYFVLVMCWADLYLLAMFLYTFLETCDPLPPCQGKVKEWWAKLSLKLVPLRIK
jgi:hypothetical protein